ncbi:Ribokinase-like protein [Mycotypha africana]|uniref:Ribokinase-like protein n=1 Tax=Mycotypha africana TaxID=64632 RepID=UPI002300AD26|nr:Ribokinase-like protein [Mycotypha africana]KAI8973683.1 Ribokinase-like protein [Mycotypha africana]
MVATLRTLTLLVIVCLAFIQASYASVFSQLQFIKISSPKNGQNIKAGETVQIKYVMQPLILNHVSAGKALKLAINFHKRQGNSKKEKITTVSSNCPVAAREDKYVTYTKKWKVPSNTKPGSYAFDFRELVQLRRGQITAVETVKSGETLSSTNYFVRAGGKGANQSIALAKAGGNVYHAGQFGHDAAWRNGRAFIQVSKETGDNCIVLYPGTNACNTAEEAEKVLQSFGPDDWIIQQNEISEGGAIMKLAAEKGLKVLFNPAPLTKGILKDFPFDKVTILVVNEHEAASLYAEIGGKKEVSGLDLANELLEHFAAMEGVVITLGGEGVVARFKKDDDVRSFQIAARKVTVKDTTGAGDTFVVSRKYIYVTDAKVIARIFV